MKKTLTIISLVAILLTLTGLYIKTFQEVEEIIIDDINERSFFKQYDIA